MKELIMSDVHGNITALNAVLNVVKDEDIEGCVLLGDLIDYGMHSNDVIEAIEAMPYDIDCNIFGNHEKAILDGEYDRFSSNRGKECAMYTKSTLNNHTKSYIKTNMDSSGRNEFLLCGKRCLAIHGSIDDPYWRAINLKNCESGYEKYDLVFSGHSHIPHFFELYSRIDNPTTRNKKKTIFINPGSVGQPRNINNNAQFAIMDLVTEEISFKKVAYDVVKEQKSYNGQVDDFYRDRLSLGV